VARRRPADGLMLIFVPSAPAIDEGRRAGGWWPPRCSGIFVDVIWVLLFLRALRLAGMTLTDRHYDMIVIGQRRRLEVTVGGLPLGRQRSARCR